MWVVQVRCNALVAYARTVPQLEPSQSTVVNVLADALAGCLYRDRMTCMSHVQKYVCTERVRGVVSARNVNVCARCDTYEYMDGICLRVYAEAIMRALGRRVRIK